MNNSSEQNIATAIFAAGCFWGIQLLFHKTAGVKDTSVGYIGGDLADPTYRQVCGGDTNHAEAVMIKYDPQEISYRQLLDIFWDCHDPTSLNRQGPDMGSQYRSAVFYTDDEQRQQTEDSKDALDKSGKYESPIVTQIAAAPEYYPAEDYHQHYILKKRGEL